MIAKRTLLLSIGALVCLPAAERARADAPAPSPPSRSTPPPSDLSRAQHERFMRLAIEQGRKNPYYPFGAVIVEPETGAIMATGTNNARANPTLHGEIVCINDYVARHGNRDWGSKMLYSTAEPCPMCMTALIFAGIGGVVFATSAFDGQKKAGMDPIRISAQDIVDATPFAKPFLLGGILSAETDRMFLERKRY
ncbi:tRNA(Arg) A34 adenosine deaminase TadA [Enhydrobacter aerosaccus]|uniref:tRNA(Arg) A34 adenosine deaminase TadA n=1 Tax=Enhydrobacter aerosaccus TaxID=225324 RepID=A0A1T4QK30_9HYPH|nr:nucleoside deaminase [Enhydrobacter aerosaccus]SKA04079.1 tRNA(Arg) A34 adenosine deaminase TadA [Enhydrobacter aerosaccus]